jgi:hypothetical protein
MKGRVLKETVDYYLWTGDAFFEIQLASILKLQKELGSSFEKGWHQVVCDFTPVSPADDDTLRGIHQIEGVAEINSVDFSEKAQWKKWFNSLKIGGSATIAFVKTGYNLFPQIEWIDTVIQEDLSDEEPSLKWKTADGNMFSDDGYGSYLDSRGNFELTDPRMMLLPPGTRKPVWSMD